MFTGIVTAVGEIASIKRVGATIRLTVKPSPPFEDLALGESVAVNGACLTVIQHDGAQFCVEVVATTQGRTRIDQFAVGQAVNLERALRVSDRLGGHIVQGHVDGVGTVVRVEATTDDRLIDIEVPSLVEEVSVTHGSITVDGVSLTVNHLPRPRVVQVSIIPFTMEHTTLGSLEVGASVHLEGDTIGKYVRHLFQMRSGQHDSNTGSQES